MPANLIKFGQGTFANYDALASKSQYEVFFCTDTHQIFVGSEEYTKSTKTLAAVPTSATAGDIGRLYYVNVAGTNSGLYLCSAYDGTDYTWTRVANINDIAGTVVSVAAEDGVETADGNAITVSGTIKHSVPTGASTHVDGMVDQTPAFGSTFAIQAVSTDKFGHVTAINEHAVTVPTQTQVGVAAGSTAASTLSEGGSFTVITGVSRSQEAGATDHDLVYDTTTFTLPSDVEITYAISSDSEGTITLTGSEPGSSSTCTINGWDLLAKKSDITTVFRYKGTVPTVADLPQTAGVQVGDVWTVTAGSSHGPNAEYVCTDATTPGSFVWEELGTTVDLSAYATTAYVEEKLSWHEF